MDCGLFGAPLEALPHPVGDHFETISGIERDGRYDDDLLLGFRLSWSVWVLPRQVTPRRNHSCGNRVFYGGLPPPGSGSAQHKSMTRRGPETSHPEAPRLAGRPIGQAHACTLAAGVHVDGSRCPRGFLGRASGFGHARKNSRSFARRSLRRSRDVAVLAFFFCCPPLPVSVCTR